jgi:hypothetical protein
LSLLVVRQLIAKEQHQRAGRGSPALFADGLTTINGDRDASL